MNNQYADRNLLCITAGGTNAMQPKRVLRLAFPQTPQTGAARDTPQENGGPLNYAGPSNTS
jgi:hypothetical protein